MTIPTFETERLILRPFTAEDVEPLHGIMNQEGILQYFPGPGNPPIEKVEKFVAHQVKQWDEIGYAWWAVELKETRRLLGWNGLQYLPETGETEIGFLTDSGYWGLGLTTEAGRIGVLFAFETVGIDELIALAHPENRASQRVIEKFGLRFVEETEYFGMAVRRFTLGAEVYAEAAAADSPG